MAVKHSSPAPALLRTPINITVRVRSWIQTLRVSILVQPEASTQKEEQRYLFHFHLGNHCMIKFTLSLFRFVLLQ